jgi:hypothetical protein
MAKLAYSLKPSSVRARREEVERLDATTRAVVQLRPRDEAVANATVQFKSPEHAVEVISTLWGEALKKFLAIGRNLSEAKRRYPKQFETVVLPHLPFGRGVAYQLRVVADAVEHGRLNEDEMPRNYSAAYQLAILDEDQFVAARQADLIKPNVQRRAIEDWKRNLLLELRIAAEGRRAVLLIERERLFEEMERVQARVEAINTRLTAIETEIGPDTLVSALGHEGNKPTLSE